MLKFEKTTIKVYGKGDLNCYILLESATHYLALVPTDEAWDYFMCYRIEKETSEGQEISLLFGVVPKEELSINFFK